MAPRLVGGLTGEVAKATVEIEVSMFGTPQTMRLQVLDIGTFGNVLDAIEAQGYIDAVHVTLESEIRAYKYPGMIVINKGVVSSIIKPALNS